MYSLVSKGRCRNSKNYGRFVCGIEVTEPRYQRGCRNASPFQLNEKGTRISSALTMEFSHQSLVKSRERIAQNDKNKKFLTSIISKVSSAPFHFIRTLIMVSV